jgi:glycosyltransferase involved in cell wall biosynthesis/peptidoglycan/xylan/chitin deacetylase (PgdA/CDA1 family)
LEHVVKIWQVGASSSPFRVDGVSRTVWLLSPQQAKLGHDVSLIMDEKPEQAAEEIAGESKMKLLHVDAPMHGYADQIRHMLEREKPDVVHMHSVFIPRQSTLGRILNEMGIPYVITPHAGLAPQVLRRGVVKKSLYAWLRERPRFMGSAAVALVTPAEERAVRSFIPEYRNPIRWMPNPVDVEKLEPNRWQGARDPNQLVYLGRFDVLVKGIDILIEIARLLPEMKVDLYGTEDERTLPWLNKLRENLPANVHFNKPIFGIEKAQMLSRASMYLQPSRWEGFPVSVAECLYLGVPSMIADTLDLAQLFFQHNLGLVVPLDPPRAAQQIRSSLADQAVMRQWSEQGRKFAIEHFHPQAVATRHVNLYEEVIQASPRRGKSSNGGIMSVHVRGALKQNVARMAERSQQLFGNNHQARTVVLCYHSINAGDADLSLHPQLLREQLMSLKEAGFEFLNFGDLVYRLMRWGPPRNDVACITFDDGFEDNLTVAAPLLSELQVPATIFLTSGLMNREQAVIDRFQALTHFKTNYLSASQVAELSGAGFEIGAHTHSHPNLARLNLEQTREEVLKSKLLLEDAIGKKVRSFAYPFGKRNIHYTDQTVAIVRQCGFMGAAAVAYRSVTSHNSIRVFELPRFFITRGDSRQSFEQKVAGHFDWLGSIQQSTPSWLKALVSPEESY